MTIAIPVFACAALFALANAAWADKFDDAIASFKSSPKSSKKIKYQANDAK